MAALAPIDDDDRPLAALEAVDGVDQPVEARTETLCDAFIYNLSSGYCMVDPYGGQGKYAQLHPCQETPSHIWQPQCDAPCSASAPEQKWFISLSTSGWYIMSDFTRRCLGRYNGPQGLEVRFTACRVDPDLRWNLQLPLPA